MTRGKSLDNFVRLQERADLAYQAARREVFDAEPPAAPERHRSHQQQHLVDDLEAAEAAVTKFRQDSWEPVVDARGEQQKEA